MENKDFLIATLSVPISDNRITKELNDKTLKWKLDRLKEWLINVGSINSRFSFDKKRIDTNKDYLIINFNNQFKSKVGFKILEEHDVAKFVIEGAIYFESLQAFAQKNNLDTIVILLCGDTEKEDIRIGVNSLFELFSLKEDERFIIIEPQWTTSILIENIKPFFNQLGITQNHFENTPYFEKNLEKESNYLSIHRVEDRLQFLLDSVGSDIILPYSKISNPYKGTTLLCTTFLPPVSYSIHAVERFYKTFGVTDSINKAILNSVKKDHDKWIQSIKKFKRYDIVDRNQLEEYLFAPDYYQMLLTADELKEQINNLIEMLSYDNYTLCLTPEAVDVAYEIQKPIVKIRTDRRNKAKPRVGRISRIEFSDPILCETFEREFWNKFRLTESSFKDKSYIKKWLLELLEKSKNKEIIKEEFHDVFLSYSSRDKKEVIEVANKLKQNGIKPWIDNWDMQPGIPWIKTLESQIEKIGACAVFIGATGFGPWEDIEQMSFIMQFVKRGCPIIPIILETVNVEKPNLPPLLSIFPIVDMRDTDSNPINKIIFGINGQKHKKELGIL
ncbi:MAG: toll/interleukin-1 receptor domain-containing protein [Bacteroidia bacterium]